MKTQKTEEPIMRIAALDPGDVKTGIVTIDESANILDKARTDNETVLATLKTNALTPDIVVIEYPHPRGQPLYTQLVDTIFWIGRYVQALPANTPYALMDRKDVKMALCGRTTANDTAVRAAILSRYPATGGGKLGQKGTKAKPGPLYGFTDDMWAALAIALTWLDTKYPFFNMFR